jgi:hypothetical protein
VIVKSQRIAELCSLLCFPFLECILEINKSEKHPVFVEQRKREAEAVIHYALFPRVGHRSARVKFEIFMRM